MLLLESLKGLLVLISYGKMNLLTLFHVCFYSRTCRARDPSSKFGRDNSVSIQGIFHFLICSRFAECVICGLEFVTDRPCIFKDSPKIHFCLLPELSFGILGGRSRAAIFGHI